MKKIVLKSALITVGALIVAGILIFSLWLLISPQTMASSSEKLGNYKFAVTCANLKYKYSGETEDLARCAEDSILSKKDKLIVKYCEKLLECDDFEEYCNERDRQLSSHVGQYLSQPNYKAYIIGTLSLSQYREGDLEKAIKTAESGGNLDCFRKLIIEVVSSKRQADIEKVKTLPQDPVLQASIGAFVDELVK